MINNIKYLIFKLFTPLIFLFIDLYINLKIFLRENFFYTPYINTINFIKSSINIDGQNHEMYQIGDLNANDINTIIMIGGIPTDPAESMTWLADELNKINPSFRIIIFNIPFYENHFDIETTEYTAKTNGKNFITKKSIDFSKLNIDPKFSHENQGIKVNQFLDALNIKSCHLVGHDRGAVILEYFALNYPDKVLSYSRGSQVWNYIEPEWESLAPDICVGPPHNIMSVYEQFRLLFFAVMILKKPLELLSDTFDKVGRESNRGTSLYDRYTHVKYKSQITYKSFYSKIKQSFIQGGVHSEVENRSNFNNTNFPIMQFQGEDEFKYNNSGTLISDQPYFGIYNLFRNEIEDIYPGCVGQDSDKYQSQYVTDKGEYKEIKIKDGARFSNFYLIPNAAHFNVIENPRACALAIEDFIMSLNKDV
jgi:pimeloyl-ACP methyl ester carboxylesterase